MMSTSLRLMVRVRVRASSTVADDELAESRNKIVINLDSGRTHYVTVIWHKIIVHCPASIKIHLIGPATLRTQSKYLPLFWFHKIQQRNPFFLLFGVHHFLLCINTVCVCPVPTGRPPHRIARHYYRL